MNLSQNWLGRTIVILLGIGLFPASSHAGLFATYGFDNSLSEQSVQFSGVTQTGLSVVSDHLAPPNPFQYAVTATSLDGTVLSANGGHVNADVAAGLAHVSFTPQAPYAWTYFDVQLDSVDNTLPYGTPGLTIKLYTGGVLQLTQALDFPHEGNNGENQHYYAYATGGDYFDRIDILYDPSAPYAGNLIHEIHNIDVASIYVPEPGSLIVWSLVAGTFGIGGLRKRQNRTTAAG